METNCERCTREVDEDDVGKCPRCELDGLCPDCLNDHDCDG